MPDDEAKAAGLARARRRRRTASPTGLDLVVSLGGDGTMLHAVDLVYPAPVPILGVNVGQLGYLTEVEPDELEASMPRLLAGDFAVSERMVLAVQVTSRGPGRGHVVRAQRGRAREAAQRPPDPPRRVDQRQPVHDVRGRRRDRRDARPARPRIRSRCGARSRRPRCAASCSRRCRRTCCSTGRSCSPTARSSASSCATTGEWCSRSTAASSASSRRATA